MHLVQILLPLYDNRKEPFSRSQFDAVQRELAHNFGGVTAFVRSAAEGLWKEDADTVKRDDVVMFEVITESLKRDWWSDYRKTLEQRFEQEEILIVAIVIEKL